ncbi:acyl-CoA thioesterase [Celeribacter sp.]|uniref:acyl-CoA thioesterase n=1 Tax=Celeribacter sp. TaxID=1890673 RepID=UPI003A8F95A1
MTSPFTLTRQVEFNHCDPAGIVFYPRYFEMISALTERFFSDALGHSWESMLLTDGALGTPLGAIEARFRAPSRLGDTLTLTLLVERIGTSSVDFAITCTCAGQTRFTCHATVVHASTANGRAAPWPGDLRTQLERFQTAPEMTE